MKTHPLTNDEIAHRQLTHKGFFIADGRVWYAIEDRARFISEASGDIQETLRDLEAAGWPTHENEIPCTECGELQPQLGGLCLRCASNYHGVE